MENHVRVYRENPIAWWDKPVMRHLRAKYGYDKKTFLILRSVYLAICEIESDFTDTPITFFSKTVGTYAGVSREVAGKYIKLLEAEGLIAKTRITDPKTGKYMTGTIIHIKSLQRVPAASPPLSGYPSIGTSQHRDTEAAIKKIRGSKKVSMHKNVTRKCETRKKVKREPIAAPTHAREDTAPLEKVSYYAELIADKLGDRKSLTFYRLACTRHAPTQLLQKAQEIVADGGARNPAAVFVHWLQEEEAKQTVGCSVPSSDG